MTPKPVPAPWIPTVCRGCTLCCDDVALAPDRRPLEFSQTFCELGKSWYRQQASGPGQCRVAGQPVSLPEAIRAAAQHLKASRSPLICGLAHLSLAEQQHLAILANQLHAAIDVDWQRRSRAFDETLIQVGRITASLGHIAQHASMQVWIDWDPTQTHPRYWERFGQKQPFIWRIRTDGSESNRSLSNPSLQTAMANEPANTRTLVFDGVDAAVEFLHEIRRQWIPPADRPSDAVQPFSEFSEALLSAAGVAFLLGPQAAESRFLTEQSHRLVRQLLESTQAWLLHPRVDGNSAGAEQVLIWNYGFPDALQIHSDRPRWNRSEFAAWNLLESQQIDCVLGCFPAKAAEAGGVPDLAGIPTIALTAGDEPLLPCADVIIPVSQAGWDTEGEVVRFDDQVLLAERVIPTGRPEVLQVLAMLQQVL